MPHGPSNTSITGILIKKSYFCENFLILLKTPKGDLGHFHMTQLDDRHGNIHLDTRLSHKPRPNPQCGIPGFGVILSEKLQALFFTERREIILGEKTLRKTITQGLSIRN